MIIQLRERERHREIARKYTISSLISPSPNSSTSMGHISLLFALDFIFSSGNICSTKLSKSPFFPNKISCFLFYFLISMFLRDCYWSRVLLISVWSGFLVSCVIVWSGTSLNWELNSLFFAFVLVALVVVVFFCLTTGHTLQGSSLRFS